MTLVNQFFPPDLSPTAHLTASLAAHLAAQGHDVTVLTGGDGYVDELPVEGEPTPAVALEPGGEAPATRGVRVIRLWTPTLGKGSIVKRLTDYGTFLAGSAWRLVRLPRQDVVISLTTPPFVVLGAVAHKAVRRRCRVVLWSMDCYPDVIERLGSRTQGPAATLRGAPWDVAPASEDPGSANPAGTEPGRRPQRIRRSVLGVLRPVLSLRRGGPASRVLRAVNRWAFRHLDHVVVLDEAMRALLLEGYGTANGGPPFTVIPNWEAAADFPAADGVRRARWSGYDDPELADRFVVLYLGNLGFGHRIETAVDAASSMGPDEQVAWLFMGGGARWDELAELVERAPGDPSVVRRPYVAKALTPSVMAGAGCALIVLADEALGVMSPSKLHANLAAGLPILYVGPAGSNVDAAIARFGCGVSLRTGDADGLAAAVRRLRDDVAWRDQLSAASRHAFEVAYCDRATLPLWDAVIDPAP